jgi:phosphoglycerate dehydrogenase-like enzyme
MDELPNLLKEADFVVNALPGTVHTKGIFDLKLFKKFKETSYFINIGRGTSVVEKDLVEALEERIIAGAGLDVFEVEPLPEISPLWKLENVIITPHYSGWTPKYTERVINIFCENLKSYLKGGKMPNLVNKELGY